MSKAKTSGFVMDWSVPSLELASIIYLDSWECGEVTLDTEKCDPCYFKTSQLLRGSNKRIVDELVS